MSSEEKVNGSIENLVADWQIAKDRANRYNRNLLQFGAAIAGVVGIFAGSAGVFAMAQRIQTTSDPSLTWTLACLTSAGTFFFLILLIGLMGSFNARNRYEKMAEETLRQIVLHDPNRFLPNKEDT